MQVSEFSLFPTRLLTLEFPGVDGLNQDLYRLFSTRDEFRGDFDMHPDSLNLLKLADRHASIATVRDMFLTGLRQWLAAERVRGEMTAEVVMFSNYAGRGEFTLAHNHNADLVGIYYVKTADYGRPPVAVPEPDGEYDYFAADDGILMLHDPRFNANLAAVRSDDYVKVFPKAGLMLIFPAYVWHSVTPHLGDFKRLALSVNVRLRRETKATPEAFRIDV
jgi:Putative 2OG-Fe(II) oxygenase